MVDIQWLIGGEAGYGIMTIGVMMAKTFSRLGMSVFDYVEYPSLIRGGHNAYYVRASDTEIHAQKRPVDILVALNRETIDKHKHELVSGSAVLYDPSLVKVIEGEFSPDIHVMPVPFVEITTKVGADRQMMNTVSVGASLALFSETFDVLQGIMTDAFGRKGEEVVAENVNTSKGGFDYVKEHYAGKFRMTVTPVKQTHFVVGGAEAVALGAIRAGVKFAAIYPMTPINGITPVLAKTALEYGIIIKEPEDEISGINMAIGASYAGARSMVATAGGGFALMVESVGLAAQTEVPLVIIEGMRPGPATGMPTWTGQGDLRFVLHAGQDEFPRIVMAPGDLEEAFSYTLRAFNLADKYQMPVIVMADKYLLEAHGTVPMEKMKAYSAWFKLNRGKIMSEDDLAEREEYKRYSLADDGVSPRSLPGEKGGISLTGSDEHDELGLYNEEALNRVQMMHKRFAKLKNAQVDFLKPELYGDKNAQVTLIGFGSTKLPVLDAINWLKNDGIVVNFIKVPFLEPFPSEELLLLLKAAKKTMVIEANHNGQFEGLIAEHLSWRPTTNFRKYDGRPFYPEEIVEKVKELL